MLKYHRAPPTTMIPPIIHILLLSELADAAEFAAGAAGFAAGAAGAAEFAVGAVFFSVFSLIFASSASTRF